MALQKFGGGGGQVKEGPAETASRKNGKFRWHCGSLVGRVWGVGEPTGRNVQTKQWPSPMALRKFGEAGLGGSWSRPAETASRKNG